MKTVELKKVGNDYFFYLDCKIVGYVHPTKLDLYSEDDQGTYNVEELKALGEKHGTPIYSDSSDGYLSMVYNNDMGLLHAYWALTGQSSKDYYRKRSRTQNNIYYIKDKKIGKVIEEASSYEQALEIVKKYQEIDEKLNELYGEEEVSEYIITDTYWE